MNFKSKGETLPTELVILAGVLITLGALALGLTVYSAVMLTGENINFMLLFFFAGLGLIRLKPFWSEFTQTISAIFLIFKGLPLIIALITWQAPYAQGKPLWEQIVFWLVTILSVGVSGWALMVLRKSSVKRLFY